MGDMIGDGLDGVGLSEIGIGCSGSFPPSELGASVPCGSMPAMSPMYFLALTVASEAMQSSKSSVVMAFAIRKPTVFRL